MNKFITRTDNRYRFVGNVFPSQNIEDIFTAYWQARKFEEALNLFPKKWVWLGENIKNELVCDHPIIVGAGIAFTSHAFEVISKEFPEETKLNHPFEIDGYKFVWTSPPVVQKEDFHLTKLNIFLAKPLYITVYSEKFVEIWKQHGFTGHEFVGIDTPNINIFKI